MRDRFVSAIRTMNVLRIVAAARVGLTPRRIRRVDCDCALVVVFAVDVMKVTVMNVVDVIVVPDSRVTATGGVLMCVIRMCIASHSSLSSFHPRARAR
jgi:hypothetical protein